MPQLTFSASIALRASIFGLEVKSSREVLEVLAKFFNAAVAEMLLTHCLNDLMGEVPNV